MKSLGRLYNEENNVITSREILLYYLTIATNSTIKIKSTPEFRQIIITNDILF